MTRTSTVLSCALVALLLPTLVVAQEEASSPPFAYGTYFECDASREWLADAIVEQLFKPAYDEAVEDGTISAWGYLGHHTGGHWRRVIYMVAPTIDATMAALDSINEKIDSTNAAASAEFGSICNRHDDYLWQSVVGSAGTNVAQERGEVGFSVYFDCHEATEDAADELVKSIFAPVYDAEVAAGNLVSWGYMQHWVGGEYRRLLTMTGTDFSSLMKARDNSVTALVDNEEAAGFWDSCHSHADYMWNIVHETP